ncbi:MAG: ATP-dependent Clp protease proteolytic subunit [Bacteroidales bacterium]|nr:ATP-dependent Clp protease proteolytic subunit [Bacteroidales bacterium]MBQ6101975.1 ATP-dependent Clp protease proteolytic subunit [Bacteroidales bacterium]
MPSWSEIFNHFQSKTEPERIPFLVKEKQKYLNEISKCTNRNVITYYSGWMQKPTAADVSINDKDINAFMEAVYKLDKSKGVDLILHTPGGDIAATEKIIDYLHSIFKGDIRAIVPQMAMSAGSMIAVSCKEIMMGKQSCLGPFDPQIGGVACQSVLKEFEKAKDDIRQNPHALGLWQVMFSKYNPTFLVTCEQAIELSDDLADEILSKNFSEKSKRKEILKAFNNNDVTKVHSRHISKDKCKAVGLNIIDMEQNQHLQDMILSLHHCYMIYLENTVVTKIVENNIGGCTMRLLNTK